MIVMTEPVPADRKRPSIYDVAARAGVSHMTVSRVLNGAESIRPETKRRVQLAIDELNYSPSAAARSLATRRAMRIGVLLDTPAEFGPNSTLLTLEEAAREHGYTVATFSHTGADDDILTMGVAELQRQGIDALCVVAPRDGTPRALQESALDIPVVLLGDGSDVDGLISIDADQEQGATLAVEHLQSLGHRSIVHLTGAPDSLAARARRRAWQAALERAGVEPRWVEGDWSSDAGYRLGVSAELMGDASAVFAGNDRMALGLVHGLAARGRSVPHEVSVVGFDDMPEAAHFLPPLTTVRQDFSGLAHAAVAAILGALEGEETHPARIPATLVVRESTAPFTAR